VDEARKCPARESVSRGTWSSGWDISM